MRNAHRFIKAIRASRRLFAIYIGNYLLQKGCPLTYADASLQQWTRCIDWADTVRITRIIRFYEKRISAISTDYVTSMMKSCEDDTTTGWTRTVWCFLAVIRLGETSVCPWDAVNGTVRSPFTPFPMMKDVLSSWCWSPAKSSLWAKSSAFMACFTSGHHILLLFLAQ